MFAAVLTLVVCSVVLHSSVEEELQGTFRVCGRALADTLNAVCDTLNKRSYSAVSGSNYVGEEYQESVDVFRSRRSALSFRPRRSFRRRGGVASECCHKSCTIQELSSYCAT